MTFTSCTLHLTAQPNRTVVASSSLIKKLKLTAKKNIVITLGHQSVNAPIKVTEKKGFHLFLPPQVQQMIRVPRAGKCQILKISGGEIQLGPLVGILSTKPGMVKPYIQAGAGKSFSFAFAPQDINWSDDTVTGSFLTSGGGWIRKTVPLPDVIYNRYLNRTGEMSTAIISLKERFIRRRIPLFNWSYLNKSEVYNLLENEKDSAQHVPESVSNPTADKIKDMLDDHQFIYLKPTGGCLGKGIMRLTYNPKNGYFARFRRNGSNVLLRFSRFTSLMNMLNNKHGRLRNYVAQQGIRLIEIDHCPIDFRFHMNKNGQNQWIVSGIGAKKAGRGSVTTHIKNGGSLMTPEQALSRAFGSEGEEVLEKAKQVAIKLAEAIERNYNHLIGELGFDIGIDRNQRIWMFEANAKPGRSIFKHPALKDEGRASLNYIQDHCLFLSKFRTRRDN